MENNHHNQTQNDIIVYTATSSVDAEDLVRALLRNWYWIALCMIVGLALATFYLRVTTPVYMARSKILIKQDPETGGALSEDAVLEELGVLKANTNLNNEIQVLRSRTLMDQVVNELGLNVEFYNIGQLTSVEMYQNAPIRLDSVRWFKRIRNVEFQLSIDNRAGYTITKEDKISKHFFDEPLILDQDTFYFSLVEKGAINAMQIGVKIDYLTLEYMENLNIQVADRSDVLLLDMKDPIRAKAKDILDKLVEVYNQAAIEDKNQVSKKTLDFIDERLKLLTQELSVVEGGLENYKEQNNIPSETMESINMLLGEISSYDNSLTQLEIQEELLGTIEQSLKSGISILDFIPSNIMLAQGEGLNKEIDEYNQLVLARDLLKRSAEEYNPELINLNNQLENARNSVLENLRSLRQGQELTIRETKAKMQRLQSRVNQIPRQERELLEIKRQQNIKEELYLFLLQKLEETALSAAITIPNARMIDPAMANNRPISPIPLQIYAVGLLFGLVIPIGIITAREIFDDNIYGEENLKLLTQIPFLGGIPLNKSDDHIVVKPASRTAIAETFRLLRTNLNYLFRSTDEETKSLLITSGQSGDGKTFVCINLGISISLTNKRVVLVGMDLRKPKLQKHLMGSEDVKSMGLTNFLIGECGVEDIVIPTNENDNLYILPSGSVPPNPAELLSKDKLSELFTYLRQQFEYIIIDTAPVGMVADAFLLEPYVEHTLLVMRAGKTKKGSIAIFERIRAEKKLPNLALTLNGIKKVKGSSYGYGYGYGYGYDTYYDDEQNKGLARIRNWFRKKD